MVFILYLIVFISVLAYRRHQLTGGFLKQKGGAQNDRFIEATTGETKNGMVTHHYGITLNRRVFFSIMPERWYHKVLKSIGLATEIQTGHSKLDDTLFFVTDQPEHFQQLLQTDEQRDRLSRLFLTYKIKSLRAFGDKIWLSHKTQKNKSDDNESKGFYASILKEVIPENRTADTNPQRGAFLKELRVIADDIEKLPTSWDSDLSVRSFGFAHFAMLFMAAHMALLGMGLCGWLPMMIEDVEIVDWPQMFKVSLLILPVLPVLWLILIYKVMGRDGWTSLVLVDFVLVGIAGLALSGFMLLRETNIRFDTSTADVKTQKLAAKSCELTCSRGSGKRRRSSTYDVSESMCQASARSATISYYEQQDSKCGNRASFSYTLHLMPWAAYQKDKLYNMDTSSSLYDAAIVGENYNIPVYNGAFGVNWVDTAEVSKAGQ